MNIPILFEIFDVLRSSGSTKLAHFEQNNLLFFKRNKWKYRFLPIAVFFLAIGSTSIFANADKVIKVVDRQVSSTASSVRSQAKIDDIDEQSRRLLDQYKATLRQYQHLKSYNNHVAKLVSSQHDEIMSYREQLVEVERIHKDIIPLMYRMITALQEFVELDVPFLLDERRRRVQALKDLMIRADISASQKYLRILEAYQIENEYGRTISAESMALDIAGERTVVDVLRIGRVLLAYLSLDRETVKVWVSQEEKWQPVASSYRSSIERGIRIARKLAPPQMLELPFRKPMNE